LACTARIGLEDPLSKIFDALSKAQGEAASLALLLIDTAGKAEPATDKRGTVDAPQPPVHEAIVHIDDHEHVRSEKIRAERLGRIVVHSDPTSTAADRFRLLRMRLRNHWTAGKLKTLLVTSPLPGDGKTTVALNLATVLMEEQGRRVVLIDADLHRGSLDQQLGLLPQAGLTECLQQQLSPLSAIRRVEPFGWHFLSSGKLRSKNPTEVLQPLELANLLKQLSPHFDWIVVDSPPVLPLSDAVTLTQHLDGTLLVARAGITPAKAVDDAIGLLGKKHIVGLVLNGIEKRDQPYSSSYHYYSR
jgi:protein-tyrosine kinase